MMIPPKLSVDQALVVLVDLQEKLAPVVTNSEAVTARARDLLLVARELNLPVLITEQNPDRLGRTLATLVEAVPDARRIGKLTFSCVDSEPFMDVLETASRTQVLLAGMESHICVYATALDLARAGFSVTMVIDACSSRREDDHNLAAANLRAFGIPTRPLVSVAYELLGRAGTSSFKTLLPLFR